MRAAAWGRRALDAALRPSGVWTISLLSKNAKARFFSRLLTSAGSLVVAGCVNLDTPSNSSDARCTITITGAAAIAGTYTCTQTPVALWVSSTNVGLVSVNISGAKSITGVFVFSGQPTVDHKYSSDTNSPNLQSYGFIVTVGAATWEFSAGQQQTPLGAGSLTFSSVDLTSTSTAGTTYATHGTIDATLVPSPGTLASGEATLHVEF